MQDVHTTTHVRWMIRRDLPEVGRIEFCCAVDEPWSDKEIISALAQRNVIGMVAEQGEVIMGFEIYELHKTHLRLLRIGVDKSLAAHRRNEAYAALLHKLTSKLVTDRRTHLRFAVDERDLEMCLRLRELGWIARRVERRHGDEADLIIFRYDRIEEAASAAC